MACSVFISVFFSSAWFTALLPPPKDAQVIPIRELGANVAKDAKPH
jgi:hypothetical protein